jgi:eukaryotic-like serine/threonine-protein kinase
MPETCPNCGTPLPPDAIFCHRCGRNFTVEMPAPVSVPEKPAAPEESDTLTRLRGTVGDRYQIERELGRGGMATVFLAKDLKHDREVAIKVLHSDLSASVGAERFEREIRLAAKLQHPNILGLYDSGSAGDLLYYVMPFVKGESLRDRLEREHMLPVEDAIAITLQVADALGYAHEQGIVHRDIKPENVLLSGNHALVADFGIARAVSQTGDRKLTQTGMSMGTPYYMAPEQASGEAVGPTADIYSLGCMLYEMLAGEPPFTGQNAMQIMARHAMEQVPSIRIVRNAVPEEVEEAIFAALGKVPADRPQSAAKFVELLGMTPGATATMRTMRLSTSGMRRSPTGMFAAPGLPMVPFWRRPWVIAVAALVLIGGGLGIWRWRAAAAAAAHARQVVNAGANAHRLAVLYFTDASADHSLTPIADGLTEALIRSLSGGSSFAVISSAGAARYRNSDLPPDSIARALGAGYLVVGQVDKVGNDRINVGVRFEDASGVPLKTVSFTAPANNLLAIRDSLSTDVAGLIRQQLGQQITLQQERLAASNTEAWLLLQRGKEVRNDMDAAAGSNDSVGLERSYHAADSLFATAASLDRKWPDPVTQRGLLAYRRSRITRDPMQMRRWISLGTAFADTALTLDPDNADALELRGDLEYWSWLENLETDPAKKAQLITAAKNDLEHATRVDSNQAGAWASLSHLYNNYPTSSNADVLAAASRAYQADEFQTGAQLVLDRLILAAYDLGQFDLANQWCVKLNDRFPADYHAARCKLLLLTTSAFQPDIRRAWRLEDSVTAEAPAPQRTFWRLNANMLVAAVIARASKADSSSGAALADSARHVVEHSLGDATVDPNRDLALYGAIAYTILGDNQKAVHLLQLNFAINPQRVAGYRQDPGWQFKSLQDYPAFRQLVGAP